MDPVITCRAELLDFHMPIDERISRAFLQFYTHTTMAVSTNSEAQKPVSVLFVCLGNICETHIPSFRFSSTTNTT